MPGEGLQTGTGTPTLEEFDKLMDAQVEVEHARHVEGQRLKARQKFYDRFDRTVRIGDFVRPPWALDEKRPASKFGARALIVLPTCEPQSRS